MSAVQSVATFAMHWCDRHRCQWAAAWVVAEMRVTAADKTEHELAGVVRRLKFDQQGTQLDCAICLRKVRRFRLILLMHVPIGCHR